VGHLQAPTTLPPEEGADVKHWIGLSSLITGLVFPDIEPWVLGPPTRNR